MIGPDKAMTHREVSKFSSRDADSLPKFEAMLERIAAFIEPTLLETPPDPWSASPRNLTRLAALAWKFRKLGADGRAAVEILTGAANPILDRWFESEELKATIATDAIIGAFASPSMPGTAYVLFHHVMGETNGKKGVWAYVRGGMGGISNALAAAAKDLGVEIRCNAEVARIKVQNGTATGVVLSSGEDFDATKVASGVDPHWTFEKFIDPKDLPPDFLAAAKRIGYESASMKINLALSAPLNFTALPSGGVGPQHHGTMHFCPDQDFIERGYDDAKYGIPSREPIVEMTMPSALDSTVAPPGKHLASMFVQYAPYKLKTGTWDDAAKNAFADRCFDIVEQYAPGFKASVIDRQMVSPLDLEKTFGLTGGSIFQGAMHLNQLFLFRPVVGYANYRTPIKNLYMCGSAAHPGGGVMGIAGYNAAREMLKWLG
jgi:phytoene dehydrogenase-like protein